MPPKSSSAPPPPIHQTNNSSRFYFIIFLLFTLASSALFYPFLTATFPSKSSITSASSYNSLLDLFVADSWKSRLGLSPSSSSPGSNDKSPSSSSSPKSPTTNPSSPTKIIAIGDLHGDYQNALRTLKMAGLVDGEANWIAGQTTFVQTGDIVDRGDDTIILYEMMIRLKSQAKEAGGLVVPLLGNHEVMNMQHDFRYVTDGDVQSFGGWKERNYAWSKEGWIGQYLRSLGVAALVNNTVFFHGGASVKWAVETVEGLNRASKVALDTFSPSQLHQVGLFGGDGPLWYRGYAQDPAAQICPLLSQALEYLNATRMVVGHTPQSSGQVLSRCKGLVYVIDVGISRVYGGHSAALEIVGDKVTGLYPNGKRIVYSSGSGSTGSDSG